MKDGHSYIIVRSDLTPAQVAVQACHAVWEQQWDHPNLVLVVVKDEEKLKDTMGLLRKNRILYDFFREPDLRNTITAVCTEPLVGERRDVLRHYMLWSA